MNPVYSISELLCIGAAALMFAFVAMADLKTSVRLLFIPILAGSLITAGILHERTHFDPPDALAGVVWFAAAIFAISFARKWQGQIERTRDNYRAVRQMKRSHATINARR